MGNYEKWPWLPKNEYYAMRLAGLQRSEWANLNDDQKNNYLEDLREEEMYIIKEEEAIYEEPYTREDAFSDATDGYGDSSVPFWD